MTSRRNEISQNIQMERMNRFEIEEGKKEKRTTHKKYQQKKNNK